MPNMRTRRGKAAELQVIGMLTQAGFDCYLTVVDDQGIDAVIRVEHPAGPRYYDIQVKSSLSFNNIRGGIAALGKRSNALLMLFNSSTQELLWLNAKDISRRFPARGSTWGDVFLNASLVEELREEGRNSLDALRELLAK
ncbi:hypothetical protein HMI51_05070 [Corallococcus coralloides]|nr:hypothetical protein [Corallococcus coralloides]